MNKELTNEQKHAFLLKRGYQSFKGFFFQSITAGEGVFTFVDTEDFLAGVKKGEQTYYGKDDFETLYDLGEAFDYAEEEFYDEFDGECEDSFIHEQLLKLISKEVEEQ